MIPTYMRSSANVSLCYSFEFSWSSNTDMLEYTCCECDSLNCVMIYRSVGKLGKIRFDFIFLFIPMTQWFMRTVTSAFGVRFFVIKNKLTKNNISTWFALVAIESCYPNNWKFYTDYEYMWGKVDNSASSFTSIPSNTFVRLGKSPPGFILNSLRGFFVCFLFWVFLFPYRRVIWLHWEHADFSLTRGSGTRGLWKASVQWLTRFTFRYQRALLTMTQFKKKKLNTCAETKRLRFISLYIYIFQDICMNKFF